MREQLRLHQIEVMVDMGSEETVVMANPIQLEQVFINLLTNARDAVADSPRKAIRISSSEEHTSELQSRQYLVCRLLLEKKKKQIHLLLQDTPGDCRPVFISLTATRSHTSDH